MHCKIQKTIHLEILIEHKQYVNFLKYILKVTMNSVIFKRCVLAVVHLYIRYAYRQAIYKLTDKNPFLFNQFIYSSKDVIFYLEFLDGII